LFVPFLVLQIEMDHNNDSYVPSFNCLPKSDYLCFYCYIKISIEIFNLGVYHGMTLQIFLWAIVTFIKVNYSIHLL